MRKYRLITKGDWGIIQKRTKVPAIYRFLFGKEYEWRDFAKSKDRKSMIAIFLRCYIHLEL